MGNLLLLSLFICIGGIVEFIYETFAAGKSFYKELSTPSRIARCLFLSLFCTTVALSILDWTDAQALTQTDLIYKFIPCAAIVAVLVGFGWYGAHLLYIKLYNFCASKTHKGCLINTSGTTWEDFLSYPEGLASPGAAALLFYHGGQLAAAGLSWTLPDDFSKDKGFVLHWCDEVKAELEKPEDECLIGTDKVIYYDATTDTRIEVRDARAFVDMLNKKVEEYEAKKAEG